MRNMQIVVSYTRSGNADKITVYYNNDSWELPYNWQTILMLYDLELAYGHKRGKFWGWHDRMLNTLTVYPHMTLDSTAHTIYHISF